MSVRNRGYGGQEKGRVDRVRRLVIEALTDVERGTFLDAALVEARRELPPSGPEAGRLHFLATGTVKLQGRLDYELNARLPSGLASLPRRCRALLRLALFELRMADVPDYAVVDEAVTLAHSLELGGLAALVNGLLRTAVREGEPEPPHDPLDRLSVQSSHPRWLLETLVEAYGLEAASALADWDNMPPPIWVRVDTSRTSMDRARELLAADGVSLCGQSPLPGYLMLGEGSVPAHLSGIEEGWLTVQDPSAGLASLIAVPLEGKRVADICAAPGGKSTHLVELGGGEVEVHATDSDPGRMHLLYDTAQRHGGSGLMVRPFEEVLSEERSYDVVLVDAPCSNLGVLRRRADARWRIRKEDITRLARIQGGLVEKGAELVRPGGVLVYSTCTIMPAENEMVVEQFLSHHNVFGRHTVPSVVPEAFVAGSGTVMSLPWRHGLDGAYAVRLIRQDTDG